MPVALIAELYLAAVAFLGIANVTLAVYVWVSRRIAGAFIAGCIAIAVGEVCLMFHLLTHAPTPEVGYTYARLRFLGMSLINPMLLIFVLQHTRLTQWLKPRYIALLFVVPVLIQFVLWFTPGHEQFLVDWQLVYIDGYVFEVNNFGPWYYVHAYYGGVLLLLSITILIWYTRHVDSSRRHEVYLLLFIATMAVFGVSNYIKLGPSPGLKLTPLTIGVLSLSLFGVLLVGDPRRAMPVAYDVVFTSISDAVLVLNQHNLVVKVNPAAEQMLGTPSDMLVKRHVDDIMRGVEGWRPHDVHSAPFDITLPGQDGKPIICVAEFVPLVRGKAEMGGLMMLHDVTAQREALALTLERERSQIIANFINDASHEFRTPLAIIKSSAYLMSRAAPAEVSKRYLDKINDHADRINGLVNDLQLMAALDSGRALDNEPIDLREIVNDALNTVLPESEARKQTLQVTIENGLPLKQGSQSEMVLAMQKALDNAIRYTPEGGTIQVTVKPDGAQNAVITIADSGVGMDADTMQQAMQRFYRRDSARTTAGFGLGLPIAQKIMERHGGKLAIDSTLNKGTTVTMTL